MDINSERKSLEGTVDSFEGKSAVIKLADGQKITWPIVDLPKDIEIGSSVRIVVTTTKTDQEEHEKIAKTILNKIFGHK